MTDTNKKILVIDDSATIRKLVDSHLSPAGYSVTLAPTAEEGLQLADEIRPDLILLDHQLPGTTGFDVCTQLAENSALRHIPVVVSSTLRKKAYVEYADLDNVVDMLPKPYTEDLLRTTVANAIETAAMIVESQTKGSAVPEIIGEQSEPDLAGRFANFGLRELIDFLNNGQKKGVLEVEAERMRLWIYLDGGRVQGITGTGLSTVEVDKIVSRLPESLQSLSQVLRLTVAGRGTSEFEGFVQLMDKRVLDPRLTCKLLRFQAAMLLGLALSRPLKGYQFRCNQKFPSLHRDLPLEVSVLGLLVEHSLHADEHDLPGDDSSTRYVRRAIRGQNLDRAGLSARHMKIMNLVTDPRSIDELQQRLGWQRDEVRRVLHGFCQAEILETQRDESEAKFVAYETNTVVAGQLRQSFANQQGRFVGKVVRDVLTLQLLVKRSQPDVIFFAVDTPQACDAVRDAVLNASEPFTGSRKVVLAPAQVADDPNVPWGKLLGFQPNEVLHSPYTHDDLFASMERVLQQDPAVVESVIPVAAPVTQFAGEVPMMENQ
ncbi:response regulator [Stieleria varia]|uniref:Alkaline phosphatase synthesis transcriptional regulatory protein PhoP n=1 Tax=Stieleria varia TaxID=2528005 RepID=A0A5C5ZNQ7_9BACT|nr:response regulator [Stieleria varia]TWT88063.1 Alkaline phosphatase synthesis transcriptional regulatory protein PhoP [Stieleria varia]